MKAWIESNPKDAKKVGGIIKKMAKIRQEGQKARSSVIAKEANVFTIDEKKYARALGKEDLELIILEGELKPCVALGKLL